MQRANWKILQVAEDSHPFHLSITEAALSGAIIYSWCMGVILLIMVSRSYRFPIGLHHTAAQM